MKQIVPPHQEVTGDLAPDFAADFAETIARLIGISREAAEVPSEVWKQVMLLAGDYIAGYRLLWATSKLAHRLRGRERASVGSRQEAESLLAFDDG